MNRPSYLKQIALTASETELLALLLGDQLHAVDCDSVGAALYCVSGALLMRPEEEFVEVIDHPQAHMSRVAIERMSEADVATRREWFRRHRSERHNYVRDELGDITGICALRTVIQFLPLMRHDEYQLLDVLVKDVLEQDLAFAHPDEVPRWTADLIEVDVGVELRTSRGHSIWIISGSGQTVKVMEEEGDARYLVTNFPTGAHFIRVAIDEERSDELMKLTRSQPIGEWKSS